MSGEGGKPQGAGSDPPAASAEGKSGPGEAQLRKKFEGALQPIVNPDATPEKVETTVDRLQLIAERYYRGPLPPPQMLAEWDQVIPGAANRILLLAEEDQRHDRWLDKELLAGQFSYRTRGQVLGFAILLFLIAGGTYCAVNKVDVIYGALFVGTAALAIVSAFVSNQLAIMRARKDEDDEDGDDSSGVHQDSLILSSELSGSDAHDPSLDPHTEDNA